MYVLLRTGLILPNCVDKPTQPTQRDREAEVPWRRRKVALGTLGSTSRRVRAWGRGRCSAYPVVLFGGQGARNEFHRLDPGRGGVSPSHSEGTSTYARPGPQILGIVGQSACPAITSDPLTPYLSGRKLTGVGQSAPGTLNPQILVPVLVTDCCICLPAGSALNSLPVLHRVNSAAPWETDRLSYRVITSGSRSRRSSR